jgi:hypothetical protein
VLLFTKESPGTFVKTTVRTIFQDIKVFAVNDVFNLESTDGQSSINAKTVSLLVTPQQVEKFTLASELGQIRLALRSHEDKEPVELAGVTARDLDEGSVANRDREELKTERPDATGSGELQNFLSMLDKPEVRAPEPAPPKPPDSWTVQLIKADAVEEVVLEEAGESPGANQPGATPSGFNFWRMISPGRSGSFRGSPPKSDAHPRPEKEEEKAGEPQPQDEPQDGPAMPDED